MLDMNVGWPFQKVKIYIQHSIQFRPTSRENVGYKCWTRLSRLLFSDNCYIMEQRLITKEKLYLKRDALRDLVSFAQFKKRF